jgi:hypothetical protein
MFKHTAVDVSAVSAVRMRIMAKQAIGAELQ